MPIKNHTVEGYINEAIKMLKEEYQNEFLIAGYNGIVSLLAEAKELSKQQEGRIINLQMDCMTHEYNNAEAERFWPQLKEQIEEPYKDALKNLVNANPNASDWNYQAAWSAAAKLLNSEQEQERSVATMPNSSNVADNQKDGKYINQ